MSRRHPERDEQARITRALRSLGCAVYTLGTTRRRGDYQGTNQSAGLPDVIVFLPRDGGVLFVEVKAPKGRLRPEQVVFRDRCRACGQAHVVGGFEAVVAWLTAAGYVHPAPTLPAVRACRLVPLDARDPVEDATS